MSWTFRPLFKRKEEKKLPSVSEIDGVTFYTPEPDFSVEMIHCEEGFAEFEMQPEGCLKLVRLYTEEELLREVERIKNVGVNEVDGIGN